MVKYWVAAVSTGDSSGTMGCPSTKGSGGKTSIASRRMVAGLGLRDWVLLGSQAGLLMGGLLY